MKTDMDIFGQVSIWERGWPRSPTQEGPYTLTELSVSWFLDLVLVRKASNSIPDPP